MLAHPCFFCNLKCVFLLFPKTISQTLDLTDNTDVESPRNGRPMHECTSSFFLSPVLWQYNPLHSLCCRNSGTHAPLFFPASRSFRCSLLREPLRQLYFHITKTYQFSRVLTLCRDHTCHLISCSLPVCERVMQIHKSPTFCQGR